MSTFYKIVKGLLILFCLFIIFTGVAWQVSTESKIRKFKENCSYLKSRQRIKYTPVILYPIICLQDKRVLRRNRILHGLLVEDCRNMDITGYDLEYMMHIYFSVHEKDSLLKAFNIDIDHPHRWHKKSVDSLNK